MSTDPNFLEKRSTDTDVTDSNLKESLRSLYNKHPSEFYSIIVLLALVAGAAIAEIIASFRSEHIVNELIFILVIGLILHFCIERLSVMNRNEEKANLSLKSVNDSKKILGELKSSSGAIAADIKALRENNLADLSDGKLRQYGNTLVNHYVSLQKTRLESERRNPIFGEFVEKFVAEETELFSNLSNGKLRVSNDRAATVYNQVANFYKDRFDAVSENDLDYWSGEEGPEAEVYLDVGRRQIDDLKTVATRIFIFRLKLLNNQTERIAQVLEKQHRIGFAWGIAIQEELDTKMKEFEVKPDFALFDYGKAISIFRKTTERKFDIYFDTESETKRKIEHYKNLHRELIPECWFVNKKFAEVITDPLEEKDKEHVNARAARFNKNLNDTLGNSVTEHENFVLIAHKPEEIKPKLERLKATVSSYRTARGIG